MNKNPLLHGSVFLKSPSSKSEAAQNPVKLMTFNPTPQFDPSMPAILMTNFRNFHFTKDEKKVLTATIRQNILSFQNLNLRELETDTARLILKINNQDLSELPLEGSGYAGFVLLSALFSGKISPEKTISFHLTSTPLALFPKALVPKRNHGKWDCPHQVTFYLGGDCWFRDISSLSQCPKFIQFEFRTVQRTSDIKQGTSSFSRLNLTASLQDRRGSP